MPTGRTPSASATPCPGAVLIRGAPAVSSLTYYLSEPVSRVVNRRTVRCARRVPTPRVPRWASSEGMHRREFGHGCFTPTPTFPVIRSVSLTRRLLLTFVGSSNKLPESLSLRYVQSGQHQQTFPHSQHPNRRKFAIFTSSKPWPFDQLCAKAAALPTDARYAAWSISRHHLISTAIQAAVCRPLRLLRPHSNPLFRRHRGEVRRELKLPEDLCSKIVPTRDTGVRYME